jgi:hypothetical protein
LKQHRLAILVRAGVLTNFLAVAHHPGLLQD